MPTATMKMKPSGWCVPCVLAAHYEPLNEPPAQPPRLVQLFIDRLRHVDVETATAEALLLGDEREENVAERSSTRGIPKTAERTSSRGIPTSLVERTSSRGHPNEPDRHAEEPDR